MGRGNTVFAIIKSAKKQPKHGNMLAGREIHHKPSRTIRAMEKTVLPGNHSRNVQQLYTQYVCRQNNFVDGKEVRQTFSTEEVAKPITDQISPHRPIYIYKNISGKRIGRDIRKPIRECDT